MRENAAAPGRCPARDCGDCGGVALRVHAWSRGLGAEEPGRPMVAGECRILSLLKKILFPSRWLWGDGRRSLTQGVIRNPHCDIPETARRLVIADSLAVLLLGPPANKARPPPRPQPGREPWCSAPGSSRFEDRCCGRAPGHGDLLPIPDEWARLAVGRARLHLVQGGPAAALRGLPRRASGAPSAAPRGGWLCAANVGGGRRASAACRAAGAGHQAAAPAGSLPRSPE